MLDESDSDLSALPRDDLVRRARALQTLLRVARAVSNTRSVEELAERFAEAVAAYTRFPSVVVHRYVPDKQLFEVMAQHGFDESKFPAGRKALPMKGSLTGLAAERREILTTDDIASDDRLDAETRSALAANQYVSGACVPVFHGAELLGSFNLVYPRGAALEADERRFLAALATTLGVAQAQQLAADRERELERQARRAQQLDSLGVLAGGIAHDFNNLLTGIIASADMVRSLAQDEGRADWVQLLDEALSASSRATSLVKQLLTFSRGGMPSRQTIHDLGRVIREVVSFVTRGTSVRCDVQITEPLGGIEGDEGQIGQVIQNLVLNACQASRAGATVLVRARREVPSGENGPRVVIEIVDEGTGIHPEHLTRIFEPFFTARSGGTGLGLAVCHSIVTRHGGWIQVTSEIGKGTQFTVEFPGCDCPPQVDGKASSTVSRFEGRALVMDDEQAVRHVAKLLLERLGFEVETAEHGESAIEVAKRAAADRRAFRVALLDLTVVGGLGAAEIAQDLRRVSPDMRLVLSTGYAHAGAGRDWDATLHKPYTLRDLSLALERALNVPARGPN